MIELGKVSFANDLLNGQLAAARSHRHPARNRSSGQAIAEGAVALWLLVTAFVLMIALGINLFFLTQWSAKANLVAQQAAKVVAVNKYWLGMARPDYVKADTEAKAKTVASKLCSQLGLPDPSSVAFTSTSDNTGDYNQVVVTVSGLPLPFQLTSLFPGVLSVSGTGVDFEPKQQIYAAMNIACVRPPVSGDPKTQFVDVACLPAFGFYSATSANPGYQGEKDAVAPHADGSGDFGPGFAPKFFRGLPLTNAFLNTNKAPLEFCPVWGDNGSTVPYPGDGAQP